MSECIESHLKPNRLGYAMKQVGSRSDGSRRKVGHHRLVYADHHGLTLDEMEGLEVDHLCFNRACINIDHLDLVPKVENIRRIYRAGRNADCRAEKNPNAKLTWRDVLDIRLKCGLWKVRQVDLARDYGVTQAQISAIVRGQTWKVT